MGLRLRVGLSFCAIGADFIFLDVAADRYFTLDAQASDAFSQVLRGDTLSGPARDGVNRLLRTGMLLQSDDMRRPAPAISHFSNVIDAGGVTASLHSAWDTAQLIFTQLRVKRCLEQRNLAAALALADVAPKPLHAAPAQPLRIARVIAARHRTTRLLSSQGQCLVLSIAMTRRLRQIAVPATLLIGVKLRPFEAHSWVQIDDMLVGEQADYIRNFTPILVR